MLLLGYNQRYIDVAASRIRVRADDVSLLDEAPGHRQAKYFAILAASGVRLDSPPHSSREMQSWYSTFLTDS